MTIYLFPGQGADKRIFGSLQFDPSWRIKHIEYKTPAKGMSLAAFSKEIAGEIDTCEKFILIGVSLGGIICAELAEILNPEKVIIISSAKNSKELPFRYRFQKIIPLYKLLPPVVFLAGAKFLQPIVEPDRNKHKATFKSMLDKKVPLYMKRTIDMIINWERTSNIKKIIHVHGDNDHTLPINKIKVDYIVKNGSHMMTLTRAREINVILKSIIQESSE